jgi:hypothetical protein
LTAVPDHGFVMPVVTPSSRAVHRLIPRRDDDSPRK